MNLTKGNVIFTERNSYKNPELDFLATSAISNYKVNVAVVGPVKNFDFNLTSEPSLEQSDILSLIAFGYTEDLSNNLSDAEKESMTRAGVGSIIFDSFKINETLKNEFGLQVNLGTEISQDESSNLASRNSDGGSSVGRVRSATTFEVKKKLDDDMSLSVSSTVGSSSTQKQSFNLNYNLNNSVSVEGVYESKSTDDQETINDDTSFGADVKWKWSFK
jgi:translocation and assembly module TamB